MNETIPQELSSISIQIKISQYFIMFRDPLQAVFPYCVLLKPSQGRGMAWFRNYAEADSYWRRMTGEESQPEI